MNSLVSCVRLRDLTPIFITTLETAKHIRCMVRDHLGLSLSIPVACNFRPMRWAKVLAVLVLHLCQDTLQSGRSGLVIRGTSGRRGCVPPLWHCVQIPNLV
mmetsp:Transcript_31934/g.76541  ORF Transcript_31934/g.76541 Transcript_31934/m.76541 type:complete len:101 (+) Transcript_31934:496-798(+)